MRWISYAEPSTLEFKFPGLDTYGIRTLVRREDQNHSSVSGNKWWKLKHNLIHALNQGCQSVITFGGAYSNHIYATAAACQELGIKSIGIIRGEEVNNETLNFARSCGMELKFISREVYRNKNNDAVLQSLKENFPNCYIVPEGGTNELAVQGCEELGVNILKTEFDYIILPVGTGGTIAGLVNAFNGEREIIGIPVLKNGMFLTKEIQSYLKSDYSNWKLYFEYHHGGYAKTSTELNSFIAELKNAQMPTEFVYTGKLFWAAADLIKKKLIKAGSTILILHTGGLRN